MALQTAQPYCKRNGISEGVVRALWHNLGLFLSRTMAAGKGVHLPGLGTFSVRNIAHGLLPAAAAAHGGGQPALRELRPMFTLLEKLGTISRDASALFPVGKYGPVVQLNHYAIGAPRGRMGRGGRGGGGICKGEGVQKAATARSTAGSRPHPAPRPVRGCAGAGRGAGA